MVQLCVIKYQPKGGISKMSSSTITWVRHYVVHVDLLIEAVRVEIDFKLDSGHKASTLF